MGYHYRESGLDNVFLEGGVLFHQTAYGEGVSFVDFDGLHRAIGLWLVRRPSPLDGAALRFIRHELDLTQEDLARRLGVDEQALRRWEKARARPIHGAVDRLLRCLYAGSLGLHEPVADLVERLARDGDRAPLPGHFRHDAGVWTLVEPVAA
jgi:DNA-binding transcriptional regulator YiaG